MSFVVKPLGPAVNASYFEFGEKVYIDITILPAGDQDNVTYRVDIDGTSVSTIETRLIVPMEKNAISSDPIVTVVTVNACSQESLPVTEQAVSQSELLLSCIVLC